MSVTELRKNYVSKSSDIPETSLGHILVAEDDVVAQMVVKKIIEQAGYTLDLAGDGKEAIKALESRHYDLVLMDCLMPGMNGFEASQAIRNADSPRINSKIPIIAMTGLTAEDDKQRCINAGMFEVISKPFGPEALIPVIRHCMAKIDGVDTTVDQAEVEVKQTWDDGFLDNVIDQYLAEVPRVIGELQQGIDEGDSDKLGQVAHRFRGATDILNVSGLSARSRALEQAAKAGEAELAITHATDLIEELNKLMRMLAD
jgi:two-component system sensor histidine kinase/response regulator